MARASLDEQLSRLATLSPAGLRAEWERVHAAPCPRLAPALLQLGLAHRLQERTHGALPAAVVRALQRVAAGDAASPAPAPALRPGTQLIREWRGRMVQVEVTETGFRWDGATYPSLSSIARAVTGAHWSGPRFFGVTPRG